jgi:hypothetical protein
LESQIGEISQILKEAHQNQSLNPVHPVFIVLMNFHGLNIGFILEDPFELNRWKSAYFRDDE